MVKPEIVTALLKSSVLTSGESLMRIDPSGLTVGVNSTFTPYGRNWMEIAVLFPVPPCTTGNGNSPPERKCAGSPLSVVSVGSASTCRICFCSRSCTVNPTLSLEL